MANTKISQLTENNNPTGWEELVYAYNSSNGKMTLNTMKTFSNTWQQAQLVSWVNIKTINWESILWSWNINIQWWGWQPTYDWSALQWPCPTWYHIPMASEWADIKTIWTTLGWTANDWAGFWAAVKMPFAWDRAYASGNISNQWTSWKYRSVTADGTLVSSVMIGSGSFSTTNGQQRARWFTIRAIKDEPVIPTISWTMTYWISIQDWWIFWSSADWLISLSADWETWITIADKNLWATTVWNNWDAESYANCWNYYQRWNNYGFDWSTVTTSSTQVDASTYWPWNYYTWSTFIKWSSDWSSVQNDNLWWWVTWPQQQWWWISITELSWDANIWELSEWIYTTTHELYYMSGSRVWFYWVWGSSAWKQMLFVTNEAWRWNAYFVYNEWHSSVANLPRCSYWYSKSSSEWDTHALKERDASLKEYAPWIAWTQTDIDAIWTGSWMWLTQIIEDIEDNQSLRVSWKIYTWVTYTIIVSSIAAWQTYSVTLWTWVTNPLNITLPNLSNKKCIITMIATSDTTAIVSWCTMQN